MYEALDKHNIFLIQLQQIGWQILGFLNGGAPTDQSSTFPILINKVTISYIFGKKVIQKKTLQTKIPFSKFYDHDIYGNKREQRIIFAGKTGISELELLTMLEVCVKLFSGKKYITYAIHEFPSKKSVEIYHPSKGMQRVRNFMKQFCNSNVCLLEPKPGL